jgi:hypothetical protein
MTAIDVAYGPNPTNRSSMLFGRYWGLNGHREALELEGSVAIDP